MQKNIALKNVIRIATNAVLIAVYVVLSTLAVSIGGFKITFEHFPVVLSAVVFGPIEGMLVGGLGEFVNQLTSFGLTPTTVLWILPIVVRGLMVGLCTKLFKQQMSPGAIVQCKVPILFMFICIVSGIVGSLLNTLALYVDSKMFGYYSFALVFGALTIRILLSILTSIVIGIAIKPILHALRHAQLI